MTARIGFHNYEAWLLDQLEGQLTAEQERELEAFLIAHPQLRPADDSMPKVGIDSAVLPDADREALKRALPPAGNVNERTLSDHLIARHERDLTPEQELALAEFLGAHPSAQREDRHCALARIAPEDITLAEPEALHRTLPPSGLPALGDLDDFLVAHLEGDLNAAQGRALSALLAEQGHAQTEWALMKATRIAPEIIAFSGKSALKRSAKVIALGAGARAWRLGAAASIAALMVLGSWWMRRDQPGSPEMARNEAWMHQNGQRETAVSVDPSDHELSSGTDSIAPAQYKAQVRRIKGSQQQSNAMEPQSLPAPEPEEVHLAHVPDPEPSGIESEPQAEQPAALVQAPALEQHPIKSGAPTLGQALTGVLRERMLALDAEPARPLDATDAEAAANRALRTVAGNRAGFTLQRDAKGRSKGFDLRLGRHLAMSARR